MKRAALMLCLPLLLGLVAPAPTLAVTLRLAVETAALPAMARLAAEIRVRSEGRVEFSLSPAPAPSRGAEILDLVRRGVLDGALVSSRILSQRLPETRSFSLPLDFATLHELDTRRVELEQPYRRALRMAGLESFGLIEQDFIPSAAARKRGANFQAGQGLWSCDFSTLIVASDRFAELQPGDRTLLLGILLRTSTQLDRQGRQANLEAWPEPTIPAGLESQSRRLGPLWQPAGA